MVFLEKRQFCSHFGRTSCHLPRFLDENLRYLGCCCCPEKTDVTLVVVVVVVVVAVVVVLLLTILLFVVVVSHIIFHGYDLL